MPTNCLVTARFVLQPLSQPLVDWQLLQQPLFESPFSSLPPTSACWRGDGGEKGCELASKMGEEGEHMRNGSPGGSLRVAVQRVGCSPNLESGGGIQPPVSVHCWGRGGGNHGSAHPSPPPPPAPRGPPGSRIVPFGQDVWATSSPNMGTLIWQG